MLEVRRGETMSIVDKYIHYVNQEVKNDPEKGWDWMVRGFQANKLKTRLLPKKGLSKGYQKLEAMMMSLVADSLSHEGSYVWGNIFAPCEILQCFDKRTLSIECLSCYFSGYHLEDYFIDCAQNAGLAPTLCSYHKTFTGAVESGVLKAPEYAVTTSLSCDGNLNTFRYLEKKIGVPFTFLDVPYDCDPDSVDYLADQLREMTKSLEKVFGLRFDEDRLRQIIQVENETRKSLLRFYELEKEHYYPGEIISQLYLMMGTHLLMGTEEFRNLVNFMVKDIQTYPRFEGKRILWVHLLPFYQETLRSYFNGSRRYQVIASDIVLDYANELDASDPFRALAVKTIRNIYNGSYAYKAEALGQFAREVDADAVIHFCHWGCKQASGGSVLLKEKMKEMGIPMLILDGDGIDKRNSHDGQIKTRLEAFLEILDEEDGEESDAGRKNRIDGEKEKAC